MTTKKFSTHIGTLFELSGRAKKSSRGGMPALLRTEARVLGTLSSVLGRAFSMLQKSTNRNAKY
jgi:hypothetical protein